MRVGVTDPPLDFAEGMAQATLLALLRYGILEPDNLIEIAREFDVRAERVPDDERREIMSSVAHNLRCLAVFHDPPPEEDPRVTMEAEFRRKQMIERTALLEKKARKEREE